MKIDNQTIDHIAKLSRLEFSEQERSEIVGDLERILDLVNKLNELDTSGVEPLIHMTDAVNMLRDDEVKQDISKEDVLRNAPQKDSDYFKVPKVVSGQK